MVRGIFRQGSTTSEISHYKCGYLLNFTRTAPISQLLVISGPARTWRSSTHSMLSSAPQSRSYSCRTWVCHKMKTELIGIRIEGHQNDGKVFVEYPDDIKVRSLEHATRVAPSFMEQLGSLTELEHLRVSLNCAYCCAPSPFSQLAVGPSNGLGQLSRLQRLEYFSVSGILHQAGSAEIVWMANHWPRLKKINLPIFSAMDNTQLAFVGEYLSLTSDYTPFFRRLEVVKVERDLEKCTGCGMLEDVSQCN